MSARMGVPRWPALASKGYPPSQLACCPQIGRTPPYSSWPLLQYFSSQSPSRFLRVMQHWAVAVAVLLTAVALNRGLSHYVTAPKLVPLPGAGSIVAVVVLMEFIIAKNGAFWTLAVLQGTAVLIAFVSVGGIATQRSPWLQRSNPLPSKEQYKGGP